MFFLNVTFKTTFKTKQLVIHTVGGKEKKKVSVPFQAMMTNKKNFIPSRCAGVPVRMEADVRLPACRSGVSYCESSSSSVGKVDNGSVVGDNSNGGGGG